MEKVQIHTEYITLGQFLKLAGIVSSGVEGKMIILDELVKVNDVIDTRRGKKLRNGDVVTVEGVSYMVVNED